MAAPPIKRQRLKRSWGKDWDVDVQDIEDRMEEEIPGQLYKNHHTGPYKIEYEKDTTMRRYKRNLRRKGLFVKAYQLAVITGGKVFVTYFDTNNKIWTYSSDEDLYQNHKHVFDSYTSKQVIRCGPEGIPLDDSYRTTPQPPPQEIQTEEAASPPIQEPLPAEFPKGPAPVQLHAENITPEDVATDGIITEDMTTYTEDITIEQDPSSHDTGDITGTPEHWPADIGDITHLSAPLSPNTEDIIAKSVSLQRGGAECRYKSLPVGRPPPPNNVVWVSCGSKRISVPLGLEQKLNKNQTPGEKHFKIEFEEDTTLRRYKRNGRRKNLFVKAAQLATISGGTILLTYIDSNNRIWTYSNDEDLYEWHRSMFDGVELIRCDGTGNPIITPEHYPKVGIKVKNYFQKQSKPGDMTAGPASVPATSSSNKEVKHYKIEYDPDRSMRRNRRNGRRRTLFIRSAELAYITGGKVLIVYTDLTNDKTWTYSSDDELYQWYLDMSEGRQPFPQTETQETTQEHLFQHDSFAEEEEDEIEEEIEKPSPLPIHIEPLSCGSTAERAPSTPRSGDITMGSASTPRSGDITMGSAVVSPHIGNVTPSRCISTSSASFPPHTDGILSASTPLPPRTGGILSASSLPPDTSGNITVVELDASSLRSTANKVIWLRLS